MPAKKVLRGVVYYCPDLRLYRYQYEVFERVEGKELKKVDDGVDYKFDGDELEDTLVAVLASSHDEKAEAEANFTSHVTGLARVNPHKIVEFQAADGEDWKINIRDGKQFWEAHDKEREEKEKAEGSLAPAGGG
jgi:hypothetical protein